MLQTQTTAPAATRPDRVAARARNRSWARSPYRIDMAGCINCDTCIRRCPSQFGAIVSHGFDVVILPELCSGCGRCLPPVCPTDCIRPDPDWVPSAPALWGLV
jgi:electron transport complex protein RnfB